jgi:hypothetical protein
MIKWGCLLALGPVAIVAMVLAVIIYHPPYQCMGCGEQVYPNPTPSVASPAAVPVQVGVPAPGSRAEGSQFARAQLSLVRLPAGALVAAAPPLVLQGPPEFGWQTGQDMTSAGGTVWRLPLSMARAVAYFRRNPPAGWRLTLADATGRISGSVGGAVNTVLTYGRGPVPPSGIWAAQVLLSLHPDGAAASLVRVDVQVGWYDSRSPAEYVAGFGSMTITGPSGTRSRTIVSRSEIATVARLLNGLPAAPSDDWLEADTAQNDCALQGNGYTVAFAVRPGGTPWTKVDLEPAEPQDPQPCVIDVNVWSTSVPGYYDYEPQPSLVDADSAVASYLAGLMR